MDQAGAARAANPAPVQEREAQPSAPASGLLLFPPALHNLARLCAGSLPSNQFAEASWPSLIRLALEHGVAPLLYLQTKDQPLPAVAREELRKIYRANLARNVALDDERAVLQAELMRQAGPVIALKGPQLAAQLYSDPGARQVADLDFLIQPEALPAADRLLEQRGFTREALPLSQVQLGRDVCYARASKAGEQLCVDMHLRLRPYGREDKLVARLWQDGMTQENLLLCLCLNLMVHRWARLQPLLDIVAAMRHARGLDWDRLAAAAQRLEWAAGVYHCLRFATQLAGSESIAALAALAGSKLQQAWVEGLLGGSIETLLQRGRMLDGPLGTLALLGCERGFAGKLRLTGSILFPPAATLRQMDAAGASLPLPLHYAQRAARKAGQGIKALAGTPRSD